MPIFRAFGWSFITSPNEFASPKLSPWLRAPLSFPGALLRLKRGPSPPPTCKFYACFSNLGKEPLSDERKMGGLSASLKSSWSASRFEISNTASLELSALTISRSAVKLCAKKLLLAETRLSNSFSCISMDGDLRFDGLAPGLKCSAWCSRI